MKKAGLDLSSKDKIERRSFHCKDERRGRFQSPSKHRARSRALTPIPSKSQEKQVKEDGILKQSSYLPNPLSVKSVVKQNPSAVKTIF